MNLHFTSKPEALLDPAEMGRCGAEWYSVLVLKSTE